MARMDDLRYPTGRFRFNPDPHPTPDKRHAWIQAIRDSAVCAPRRPRRPVRPPARHAVSAGRLDGPAARPPRARQPHERVRPLQAGADRGQSRRSSRTTKLRGRSCRHASDADRRRRSRCWRRCTSAGSPARVDAGRRFRPFARCIPSTARSPPAGCCSSTRGTALTTWHTSRRCDSGRAGGN